MSHIKNALYASLIIALLGGVFVVNRFVGVYDRSNEPTEHRSFLAFGEGTVVAVPDVARVSFSVITEGGTDVAALQQTNSEKTNSILDFVKKQDISKEDIKTQGYSVQPRYQYATCRDGGTCPPPVIVGYTVSQHVELTIRDFEDISPLLSGVVQNGANEVSQLSFEIDDPTSVENQAREEAIAKAKEKAEGIAKAAGFKVGRILSISEGYSEPYLQRAYAESYALDMKASAGNGAPTIEAGSQEVVVSVTVTYEIE